MVTLYELAKSIIGGDSADLGNTRTCNPEAFGNRHMCLVDPVKESRHARNSSVM